MKYAPYAIVASACLAAFLMVKAGPYVHAQATDHATVSLIPLDFYFQYDLRLGDTLYPDVGYLQYLLDSDERTVVATSGPGSIYDLTSYYGNLTQDAVSRFQDLYSGTILDNAGIASSTGYFGVRTRSQANLLLNYIRYANATSTATSSSAGSGGSSGKGSFPGDATLNAWVEQFAMSGLNGGTSLVINQTNQHWSSLLQAGGVKNGTGFGGLPSYFGGAGGSGLGGAGAGAVGGGSAAGGTSEMPFGGMVVNVTYCTCSSAIMLDINDVVVKNISLLYIPGASQLYREYNVNSTGQQVLGTYTQGGTCMVYHGEECSQQGSPAGTIKQIGTSAQ